LAGVNELLGAPQAAVERKRRAAVFRVEIGIARAFGEAVRLAHDGADGEAHVKVQVSGKMADDQSLLEILLAEAGHVWPDDVEELDDHRRHAAEMTRARGSLERRGESARLNVGIETVRVDIACIRREDGINLQRNEQVEVLFEIPRIAGEILARAE